MGMARKPTLATIVGKLIIAVYTSYARGPEAEFATDTFVTGRSLIFARLLIGRSKRIRNQCFA